MKNHNNKISFKPPRQILSTVDKFEKKKSLLQLNSIYGIFCKVHSKGRLGTTGLNHLSYYI